ncbi:MAG: DUF2325 domain-containing protein, partial [Chromatiales bacterium]|nr:DUF2325 domain-containing protein [Chromatiales bacterium]
LKQLEQEHKTLQETLSKTRQTHHQQIARRDEVIRKQEQELLSAMSRNAQLPADDDSEVNEVRKQNQMLAKRLDWTESQLADRDIRLDEMREEIAGLKELLAEARLENGAMVEAMEGLLGQKEKEALESPMQIDLSGKRILYVGGRSTLAPHLRSLVEAHNGRFEHHDGGLEDSRYGLQFTLAGADMVFCPIDCISHDACRRVKHYCKQQSKQFIPLRTSGLSAFAAGLKHYSSTNNQQPLESGATGQH